MVSSPQVSPPKPYTHLSSRHTCYMHLQSHFLYLITQIIFGKKYRSLSSTLCNFLHSPVTSSLLGPNNLLNTLFSNTLSLHSSLNVSDQVSHPYRTKGKITIQYISYSLYIHLFVYICIHIL